jgi:hypothetical protein
MQIILAHAGHFPHVHPQDVIVIIVPLLIVAWTLLRFARKGDQ